jgi:agmatinase
MYNVLKDIPSVQRLVQVGVRDYCQEEWDYIGASQHRVVTYFDRDLQQRRFEGETWRRLCDDIISHLPPHVYISFDIDGLDPKLCPSTGTPVPGGLEAAEVLYLFRKVVESGRKLIGFDLVEIGVGPTGWDTLVGAQLLFKLSNLLIKSNT